MSAVLYHIEHGAGFDASGTWHEPRETSTMPADEGRYGNAITALWCALPFLALFWLGFFVLARWLWRAL